MKYFKLPILTVRKKYICQQNLAISCYEQDGTDCCQTKEVSTGR